MSLESTHPLYDLYAPEWSTLRDMMGGERAVKAARDKYLSPTASMIIDGFGKGEDKLGEKVYQGYLQRAQFPDYFFEAVETYVGMLNHKPATFELPPQMQPLLESCTLEGETLHDFLRNIHREQLTTSRIGIMADLPKVKDAAGGAPVTKDPKPIIPYLTYYVAESVRNWDSAENGQGFSALNLVILDESGYERMADFTWERRKRFRVLALGPVMTNEPEGKPSVYRNGLFTDAAGAALTYNDAAMEELTYLGNPLNEVPFVFINTRDLLSTPDLPPLSGLGKLVLAIYRGEADYRQGLFMTGQDTLVVKGDVKSSNVPGAEDALRTGAGARIDVDANGDAKYIGVNSQGLPEQRASLENDHKRASTKAGQLLPSGKSNSQESGEALKTRLGAQTASMTQIAQSSAQGLERILKTIATWMGADPNAVKVTPNLEFGELPVNITDLTQLMSARLLGAPLSKKSIHQVFVNKRLTNMSFEDEIEQIKEEDADMPPVQTGGGNSNKDE